MSSYNPQEIEPKWRKIWEEKNIYATPEAGGDELQKFYSLYSYPYPSGEGLHVGHIEGLVTNDIVARFNRMLGKKVLFPMGWDSFGLPAENYAIKTGVHPQETTDKAVVTFKEQINRAGISADWAGTEVAAHWPEYYKWTQWIFIQMFKKGLAYKKKAPVNWCPKDQTVLANEQVLPDGTCERCGTQVVQKELEQWFFKITDYAERLHHDLDKVDWPNGTKVQQRNWIGRSEGAKVKFKVVDSSGSEVSEIEVFTTAYDTIYGVTFMAIAPEHKLLHELESKISNMAEIKSYLESANKKSELDRQVQKEKTGIQIQGLKIVNPIDGKQSPIFVADYVLMTYGTGAVMGVPGHDERDFEFANKYNLPVIYLTQEQKYISFTNTIKLNPEKFIAQNTKFDGKNFAELRELSMAKLIELGVGEKTIEYRLRDWLLSRQRYWGCPIPIVYDPEGNPHAVDESDLPVIIPTDVDFLPTGESPIVNSVEFQKGVEEKYGKGWRREYDTMDTFVDSSWYFFRHADANNSEAVFDSDKVNFWLPADLYMIGAEHTVLHLLYARFFTKFLNEIGLIDFDEPFQRMRHMGTVLGPDGRKMSKRWGNVINPNDQVDKYGADTLRMYEMFMGPLEMEKPWNDKAVAGVFRFLNRVFNFSEANRGVLSKEGSNPIISKLVSKVKKDIPELSFNTSVAEFMKALNEMEANPSAFSVEDWKNFLLALAPFAPFVTEEMWAQLGNSESIHLQKWPELAEVVVSGEANIVVQVNGKHRANISIPRGSSQEVAENTAKTDANVSKFIEGKEIVKVIWVPDKLINIVIR